MKRPSGDVVAISRRDPEIQELTESIRELTGRARTLSEGIDEAVTELREFRDDVATLRETVLDRRSATPREYSGQERRRR